MPINVNVAAIAAPVKPIVPIKAKLSTVLVIALETSNFAALRSCPVIIKTYN